MTSKKTLVPQLGMMLRDKLTGFKGVGYSMTTNLYGMKQFNLQPVSVKGEAPGNLLGFDIDLIEAVNGKVLKEVVKPHFNNIRLGDVVKDIHSEAQGTALCRYVYINGCVYYVFVTEELGEDGNLREFWMNQDRLTVIKANRKADPDFPVPAAKALRVTSKSVPADPPGGPMSRNVPRC